MDRAIKLWAMLAMIVAVAFAGSAKEKEEEKSVRTSWTNRSTTRTAAACWGTSRASRPLERVTPSG